MNAFGEIEDEEEDFLSQQEDNQQEDEFNQGALDIEHHVAPFSYDTVDRELAVEAVNKIKRELLLCRSPRDALYNNNFAVFAGQVHAKMERIAVLVDWRDRYLNDLGKIKAFLLTYSLCQQEFEVIQDPENRLVHYVRHRASHVVRELPLIDGNVRRYMSDEVSVSADSDAAPPRTAAEIQAVERRALEEIRRYLLSEAPSYSLKLTNLNAVTLWSRRYGLELGSMKQWLRGLIADGIVRDIHINDSHGPGNDFVFLQHSGSNPAQLSPAREPPQATGPTTVTGSLPGPLPAPAAPSQPSPNAPTDASRRSNRAPLLLNDTVAGIRVSDYFFLPLPTDLIELSYHRGMVQNTALVRRWTDKRILRECWRYDTESFKKFSWLGDSVLHAELSKTLLMNYSFLFDVSGLHSRRENAEQRLTLSLLFDELRLAQFVVHCPGSWVSDYWKAKCDFVEALVGELVMRTNDPGESGIPFGHPERESILRFIKTVCEAALDRGAKMKSLATRQELNDLARRPGNGGLLMEALDRAAIDREQNNII